MAVVYRPTIENLNLITEKSKTKKDGVYSFRGIVYRVKSGRFTHFAFEGEVLERAGNFNVIIGPAPFYDAEKKKLLSKL